MKQKLLLTIVLACFFAGVDAQKKQQSTTAYAITGAEKGGHRWSEVRLIDVNTGEEVQSVYQSSNQVTLLNARTGKPVAKKAETTAPQSMVAYINGARIDVKGFGRPSQTIITHRGNVSQTIDNGTSGLKPTKVEVTKNGLTERRIVIHQKDQEPLTMFVNDNNGMDNFRGRYRHFGGTDFQTDRPFATNSAACAYDKKHDRLYYTPLDINQLRYIDLGSKEPKIYYFEDEPFGASGSRHDSRNQITRMVFSSEGDGYALTNTGEHLIRFTTNKKAEITDLGSLNDAAENSVSIHSREGFGGDMIADDDNNLYLITANRNVFKISIDKMLATYIGAIKGLPNGYSTNGAAVEKETSVILSSARSTLGYYKFDIKTLEAEKMSASESVFTASDLANGNLLTERKKNKEKVEPKQPLITRDTKLSPELLVRYKLSAYPNPGVRGGTINLSFNDFPYGRYQVQLVDLAGKIISAENMNIGGKMQLHLLGLPKTISQGTYLVKIVGDANRDKVLVTEQVVVQ